MTLKETRTWSIWDPVKPTSPVSCSLSVDRGRSIQARGVGSVFDVRYLINLGAIGEGEEEEVGLKQLSLLLLLVVLP